MNQSENNLEKSFNEIGDYNKSFQWNSHPKLDINKTDIVIKRHCNTNKLEGKVKSPDHNMLRPYLLYVDNDTILHPIDVTTQYGHTSSTAPQLKYTYRSPFPVLNVLRRKKSVATDTVNSSVLTIDNDSKLAQFFCRQSWIIDTNLIKTEKEFFSTLQENIWKRGAMDLLISDWAKIEISKQDQDIL